MPKSLPSVIVLIAVLTALSGLFAYLRAATLTPSNQLEFEDPLRCPPRYGCVLCGTRGCSWHYQLLRLSSDAQLVTRFG